MNFFKKLFKKEENNKKEEQHTEKQCACEKCANKNKENNK